MHQVHDEGDPRVEGGLEGGREEGKYTRNSMF